MGRPIASPMTELISIVTAAKVSADGSTSPVALEPGDVLLQRRVHLDASAAGEVRHFGSFVELTDRVDEHGAEGLHAFEVRAHPLGELALRMYGYVG